MKPKEIEKFVTLGKVQAVERVDETKLNLKQNKPTKKSDNSKSMYEEDTTLTIEL